MVFARSYTVMAGKINFTKKDERNAARANENMLSKEANPAYPPMRVDQHQDLRVQKTE